MPTTGKQNPHSTYSLYIHIPFCKKKCDYCHFYVLPDQEESKDLLLKALKQHWQVWDAALDSAPIHTLYFGGGTPALFGAQRLAAFIETISHRLASDCEITLEANPDHLVHEPHSIKNFRESGINRLSIGVQTLDEALLPPLGRTHTAIEAMRAVEQASAFFNNITIDLMYDLPRQSLESWQDTLDKAVKLPIQHLSLYNLIIEPESLFYKKKKEISLLMPIEEASAEMYTSAVEALEKSGFNQYEISAFAKEGFASKHNSVYWKGEPFLGLGPSAFSYLNGRRFRQHRHLKKYCESVEKGESTLDFEEHLEGEASERELFAIHLRLLEGAENVGPYKEAIEKDVEGLIKEGLLQREGTRIKMTRRGTLFYDTIARSLIF